MAKRIRSLDSSHRRAAKAAANNTPKAPKKNSTKGLARKEEANRRVVRDLNAEASKRPALRAAKKAAGPVVVREKKTVHCDHLFDGMTPRQIKRTKRSPQKLKALREANTEQK